MGSVQRIKKKMDRNGYIPLSRCHHPKWLSGIPRSQFVRIRWNCSDKDEFLKQSEIIRQRSIEKGYPPETLDVTILQIASMEREGMLVPKDRSGDKGDFEWSFHTTYSKQYGIINKLLNKHWKVLKNDEIMGTALPECPKVIFRKALALSNCIAPNVVEPPL